MGTDLVAVQVRLGELSPTGLTLPKKLDYGDWFGIGEQLTRLHESTSWALADWLFYGEWTYGQRYEDALELTGLGYQTLRDLKYVAGRFQMSRRHDKLTITHHREVAALPPRQADELLALAEENGWSCSRLREEVQVRAIRRQPDDQRDGTPPGDSGDARPVSEVVGLEPDTRESLVADWLRNRFGELPGQDWVELAREAIALVEVAA